MDAEDFRQIRDAVRQLVREEVIPLEERIEDEDRIPDELRAQIAAMGLFGYALPEEHGGLGVNMREDVALAMEFGYTTPAFRSLFGTNNGISGQVIAKFGSDEQKKKYLPGLAAGELIGSFALTEAEAGSDPAALRTALEGVERLLLISGDAVGARVEQHTNVIEAARDAGVAHIVYTSILNADASSNALADEHIAAGRLVRILPDYHLADIGIYAVYTSRSHLAPKVRSFIDYLVEHIGAPAPGLAASATVRPARSH